MSHLHGALLRELAHALSVALGSVLGASHSPQAVRAAIDTSQVLGLRGLERLLGALLPHASQAWPVFAMVAVERLRALTSDCVAASSIVPIQAADAELAALADRLVERGDGAPVVEVPGEVPTLGLGEVLEDLPLADDASRARARRVRVTAPVAAALRAALDWLEEEGAPPRPLRLSGEESVVDVVVVQVNHAGLKAAEKVLSVVGGVLFPASVLGPGTAPAGSWIVRVPSVKGLHSHLMLIQGDTALALPWHAVLRLYMVRSVDLDGGLTRLGSPVLPPIRPLARGRGEHPVVLVGSGLRRAYLVADELVWRLEAQAHVAETSAPSALLTRAVATDDGETYWVLDPSAALASIEPPATVPVSRTRAAAPADLPVLRRDEVEPLDAPQPAPASEAAASAAIPETPHAEPLRPAVELPATIESREPRTESGSGPATITPLPLPPSMAHAPEPPAESLPLTPRRALIAEDSIAVRMSLTRMLEREGFSVRAVITATELFDELVDDSWSLLCIDVELPDRRERDLLEQVVAVQSERSLNAPIVALVRDDSDIEAAQAAGIGHTLKKPFDRESLVAMLLVLGLTAENQP